MFTGLLRNRSRWDGVCLCGRRRHRRRSMYLFLGLRLWGGRAPSKLVPLFADLAHRDVAAELWAREQNVRMVDGREEKD